MVPALDVARVEVGVGVVEAAAILLLTATAAAEDEVGLAELEPELTPELAFVLRVVAPAEELALRALETLLRAEAALELAIRLEPEATLEAGLV